MLERLRIWVVICSSDNWIVLLVLLINEVYNIFVHGWCIVSFLYFEIFIKLYLKVHDFHKQTLHLYLLFNVLKVLICISLLGFIMMTPQLFINYKLKSVAHLPWRMLTYKALNTFIDDIFAFVIKMPTMYRLGCLRDDVIFFIFLYQVRNPTFDRLGRVMFCTLPIFTFRGLCIK